jgi:hypothetical protein
MKTGDKVRVLHLEDAGTCLVPATIIGEGNLPDSVKVRLDDGTEKTTLTVYVSGPGPHQIYTDRLAFETGRVRALFPDWSYEKVASYVEKTLAYEDALDALPDDDPGTYRRYADNLHRMGLGTGIG